MADAFGSRRRGRGPLNVPSLFGRVVERQGAPRREILFSLVAGVGEQEKQLVCLVSNV